MNARGSAQRGGDTPKRKNRRIRALTAAITGVAVVLSSVTGWVLLGGVEAAQAGTVGSLRQTSDAGAWHTVAAPLKVSGEANGAGATLGGFGEAAAGADAEPVSWMVQVTATADAATARLRLRTGDGEAVPLLTVPAGGSASTSVMLRTDGSKPPAIFADAGVTVEAETIAYLVPLDAGSHTPAPGGSVATGAFALADTQHDLGFVLRDVRAGTELSPLGLGGVPSSGVAAVWLQVRASGDAPAVSLGSSESAEPHTVVASDGDSAAGLVAVPLDEAGLLRARISEQTDAVSLTIVGWTAGAQWDVGRATVNGGLMLGGPFVAEATSVGNEVGLTAPAVAPDGAASLFSVSFDAGDGARVGVAEVSEHAGELGAAPTGVSVAGTSSAIVVAESAAAVLAELPDAIAASWLGYFPAARTAAGNGAVEVEFTSPQPNAKIDLLAEHGLVTLTGTARADAGIESVHLKRGNRYLGAAQVRMTAEGYVWEYRTSTPYGAQELEVVASDVLGSEARAKTAYSVDPLRESDLMIAENVAVVGDDLMEQLREVTPDSLSFAGDVFVKPGDIVTVPVSTRTPDGALRRILSVQLVDGEHVLGTENATMADVLLNGRVQHEGLLVETTDDLDEVTSPASSGYAFELDGADGGSGQTGGGGAQGAIAGSTVSRGIPQPTEKREREQSKIAINESEIMLGFSGSRTKDLKRDEQTQKREDASWKAEAKLRVGSAKDGTSYSVNVPVSKLLSSKPAAKKDSVAKDGTGSATKHSFGASFELSYTTKTKNYADFDAIVEYSPSYFFGKVPTKIHKLELVKRDVETSKLALSGQGKYQLGVGPDKQPVKGKRVIPKEIHIGTVAIPIGPVPIPVSFYLELDWYLGLTVTGDLDFSTSWGSVQESGFSYENGRVEPVSRYQKTSDGRVVASVEAKVGLEVTPKFEIRVAGAVGGFIGLENEISAGITVAVGASGTSTVTSTEEASSLDATGLQAGGKVTVKGELDMDFIIGLKLTVFGWWDLFEVQKNFTVLDGLELFFHEWPFGKKSSADDSKPDEDIASRDRPTVLVFDVSGSMAGDRIASAKTSLRNVVNAQQPGTTMGLWTYPNDSNCGVGEFQVDVMQHEGTAQLNDAIVGLEAGGSTPTGEALLAVADELEALGYRGGNLLLVSDGEANCDSDPIAAAKELRERGFSVSTIPFGDDPGVNEQMQEIADEGGGVNVPVDPQSPETDSDDPADDASGSDSTDAMTDEERTAAEQARDDELFDVIQDLTQPKIEITLTTPSTLQEGDVQRVEVRIENTSARDVTAAQFSITANDLAAVTADPASSIVGNLPVGAAVTRSVDVTVEKGTKHVNLQVLGWGSNTPIAEATASFTVLPAGDPELDPDPDGIVTETDQDERHLLVLGDAALTVAAEDGALVESQLMPHCTHGETVAGQEMLEWDDVTIAACAEYAGIDTLQQELAAAGGVSDQVSTVMLSIGAAEIGLPDAIAACLENGCTVEDPDYQNAVRAAQELDLTAHLTATWASVNGVGDRARSGKAAAPLLVAPYPLLFPEDRGLQCNADIGPEQMVAVNLLTSQLNASIASAVDRAREMGVEAYTLENTETALQSGASLCDPDRGMIIGDPGADADLDADAGADAGSDTDANADADAEQGAGSDAAADTAAHAPLVLSAHGGTRIARSIGSWSEHRQREFPREAFVQPAAAPASATRAVGLSFDAPSHSYGVAQRVEQRGLQALTGGAVVQPGQRIDVAGGGYAPGSTVFATAQTDRVAVIGRGVADADGRVRFTAVMSEYDTTGSAQVFVTGVNEKGQSVQLVSEVSVAAQPPLWVVWLFWGAPVLLIAAGALALLAVRARRTEQSTRVARTDPS